LTAHVDFVAALFVVWGALMALVGASTLALGVGVVALASSPGRGRVAAGVVALAFMTLASIAIAWGVAHMLVGFRLRRRLAWARLVALMLGSIDLLLLPYGTLLGGYALWALLNERGKALFEVTAAPRQP
jgi:hypothetical protein